MAKYVGMIMILTGVKDDVRTWRVGSNVGMIDEMAVNVLKP